MTEVPKIVRLRLFAANPEDGVGHPDPDVLAAFVEHSLSPTERVDVVGHLAACRNCREVLMLALPVSEREFALAEDEIEAAGIRQTEKKPRNRFAWASFSLGSFSWGQVRWAALAAGIAVAALVAVPRWERAVRHQGQSNAVVSERLQAPAPPVSASPAASGASPLRTEASTTKAVTPQKVQAKAVLPKPSMQRRQALPSPQRGETSWAANQTKDFAATGKASPGAVPGAETVNRTLAKTPSNPNEQGKTQVTVEAGAEISAETSEARLSSPDSGLLARGNAPPVEKAKPGPDGASGGSVQTATANVAAQALVTSRAKSNMLSARSGALPMAVRRNASWMISSGVLQRSLDGGQTWQDSIHSDHPLLCFATSGQDVWAGGQGGALLHSTDNGTTWNKVGAAYGSQTLSADVTHIEVHGPAEITLTTGTGEIWTTADAGKTWEKK